MERLKASFLTYTTRPKNERIPIGEITLDNTVGTPVQLVGEPTDRKIVPKIPGAVITRTSRIIMARDEARNVFEFHPANETHLVVSHLPKAPQLHVRRLDKTLIGHPTLESALRKKTTTSGVDVQRGYEDHGAIPNSRLTKKVGTLGSHAQKGFKALKRGGFFTAPMRRAHGQHKLL
jgi:hypothetical protein